MKLQIISSDGIGVADTTVLIDNLSDSKNASTEIRTDQEGKIDLPSNIASMFRAKITLPNGTQIFTRATSAPSSSNERQLTIQLGQSYKSIGRKV